MKNPLQTSCWIYFLVWPCAAIVWSVRLYGTVHVANLYDFTDDDLYRSKWLHWIPVWLICTMVWTVQYGFVPLYGILYGYPYRQVMALLDWYAPPTNVFRNVVFLLAKNWKYNVFLSPTQCLSFTLVIVYLPLSPQLPLIQLRWTKTLTPIAEIKYHSFEVNGWYSFN